MSEMIEMRSGIFRRTPAGDLLLGARCRRCGMVYFPSPPLCLACSANDLDEIELSRKGELFSHTTVHTRSAHFAPPYSVGYVRLPEGVTVFAPLRTTDDKPLRVGMPMALEIVPLWTEDGKDVLGYRFFPD